MKPEILAAETQTCRRLLKSKIISFMNIVEFKKPGAFFVYFSLYSTCKKCPVACPFYVALFPFFLINSVF